MVFQPSPQHGSVPAGCCPAAAWQLPLLNVCTLQQLDGHAGAWRRSRRVSCFPQANAHDYTEASDWLLGEGVVLIGGVLQRPEIGLTAPPEVAHRVATLCRTLLAAARDESSGSPAVLQHVLQHLQPAVPTCLQ
jgi:hypothetical protein